MSRAIVLATAMSLLAAGGCVENTAPGNDREAGGDPPPPPAEVVSAEEALSGVSTGLLMPEIMTDPDQRNAPGVGEPCRFRMTEVGFPVLVYGTSAVVKLNGKLVPLPREGDGRYQADGIEVSVRPLDGSEVGEQFAAELVLRLPGASNELGFHGYADCGS